MSGTLKYAGSILHLFYVSLWRFLDGGMRSLGGNMPCYDDIPYASKEMVSKQI